MADLKAAEVTVDPAKTPASEAATAARPAEAAKVAPAETPAPVSSTTARKSRPAQKAVAPVKKAKRAVKPLAKKIPAAKAAVVKTVARPARAAAKATQGVKIMATKTFETPFAGTEQFKNAFGDINERAKTAMEKGAKVAEEMADLTRGNVEAFVASSKVAAKGIETLSQDAAEYGRKSFEEASAAFKSFAEIKSPTDFFKLQSDFARSAFDAAVAESARVSEAMIKIAGDVAEPITSRYSVAAERVKTLAA